MNSISNIKIALGLSDPPLHTVQLSSGLTSATVDVLRTDLIHPVISGNKSFKLFFHLLNYQPSIHEGILSFGGAYSNHLVATAAVCYALQIPFIAIIRGEAPSQYNHSLQDLLKFHATIKFVSRNEYPQYDSELIHWQNQYPHHYIIPMGGEGLCGIQGAASIADSIDLNSYDHIFVPVGTGTTLAGLMKASSSSQQTIHGVLALKFPIKDDNSIVQLVKPFAKNDSSFQLHYDFHFGGFGKSNSILWNYMNDLYDRTQIPTDHIYTAKMFYAVESLLKQGELDSSRGILLIHTGGLQGNRSLAKDKLKF